MRSSLPRVVGPVALALVLALTETYEFAALGLSLGVTALVACRAAFHLVMPGRLR